MGRGAPSESMAVSLQKERKPSCCRKRPSLRANGRFNLLMAHFSEQLRTGVKGNLRMKLRKEQRFEDFFLLDAVDLLYFLLVI